MRLLHVVYTGSIQEIECGFVLYISSSCLYIDDKPDIISKLVKKHIYKNSELLKKNIMITEVSEKNF